jgi:hypothetical protein
MIKRVNEELTKKIKRNKNEIGEIKVLRME